MGPTGMGNVVNQERTSLLLQMQLRNAGVVGLRTEIVRAAVGGCVCCNCGGCVL